MRDSGDLKRKNTILDFTVCLRYFSRFRIKEECFIREFSIKATDNNYLILINLTDPGSLPRAKYNSIPNIKISPRPTRLTHILIIYLQPLNRVHIFFIFLRNATENVYPSILKRAR